MEIRKIKPEEKILQSLVSTIVFLGDEPEEYKEWLKNPLEHSDGYENVWAGFDDAGKMCSSMVVHDYKIRFDGHTVGMGGVGGVATLPECRKGGYIRHIFEKALPDMKERGMVFSFLYPFSFAFYRKFGYELCYTPNCVSVPMSFFRAYPFPDHVSLYMPGDDLAPFAEVYDSFSRNLNLAFVRDHASWERMLEKDPYVTRHYAYLHRDGDGRPDAYLLFKADLGHGDEGNTLRVKELAWTGTAALHAMFGFLGGLDSQFEHLRWNAPGGLNIHALFSEGYEINARRPACGMNRIVDVRRALELLQAPACTGRAVIGVFDKFMSFNTGHYALEWDAGKLTVKPTDRTADLETDVETLAQLVTGFLTPDEARYRRGVAISGNEASLRALFTHKDLYVMERF